jgi:hypothetical protein
VSAEEEEDVWVVADEDDILALDSMGVSFDGTKSRFWILELRRIVWSGVEWRCDRSVDVNKCFKFYDIAIATSFALVLTRAVHADRPTQNPGKSQLTRP